MVPFSGGLALRLVVLSALLLLTDLSRAGNSSRALLLRAEVAHRTDLALQIRDEGLIIDPFREPGLRFYWRGPTSENRGQNDFAQSKVNTRSKNIEVVARLIVYKNGQIIIEAP